MPEIISCIKCGSTDISTDWHRGLSESDLEPRCDRDEREATGKKGEHLHRHCRNCHYQWRDALNPPTKSESLTGSITATKLAYEVAADEQASREAEARRLIRPLPTSETAIIAEYYDFLMQDMRTLSAEEMARGILLRQTPAVQARLDQFLKREHNCETDD
jgi:RNA polymerase subunit RPABC4/transcription elongation factor Spt4